MVSQTQLHWGDMTIAPPRASTLILSGLVNPMILFGWLPVLTLKVWPRNSCGLLGSSQGNEINGLFYSNAHLLKSLRGQCARVHQKPHDMCYSNRLVVEADMHIPYSASKLAIKGICKQTKQCYSLALTLKKVILIFHKSLIYINTL